jgi:4-amino-4-deoxy-L-arabinose transferase-like glycosyltransferase
MSSDQLPQSTVSSPSAEGVSAERFCRWDALALAGALFCLLWGLGNYAFYEPHEGHFAGVGREMVLRDEWIVPHLNGGPYLNKPPVFYWLIAVSNRLFGINEWSARLPLALTGWVCAWLLWWWGRKLWGGAAGRSAVVFLTVSFGWCLFSHQLLIDLLLATLNVASLFALWIALRRPEKRGPWFALYGLLGLGVLSKGFVALAFPFCAGLVWLFMQQRSERGALLKNARLFTGFLIILALNVWWALWVEMRIPGFIEYIIVNEHWKRLFNERTPKDYNEMSVWAYWLISLVWMLPAGFLLPAIAAFVRAEGRKIPQNAGSPERPARPAREERRRAVILLAAGGVAPIILFTFSPARLPYYGLPAAPIAALLAGGWLALHARGGAIWQRMSAGLTMAAFGAAVLISGFFTPPLLKGHPDLSGAPDTAALIGPLSWWLGGTLLAAGFLLSAGRANVAATILFLGLGSAQTQVVEGFRSYQNVRSSKMLVERADRRLRPDALWVFEGSREIGAAAGISRWLKGSDADGRPYRIVLVMSDDPRRPPPTFPLPPDDPRNYLLDRPALDKLWAGSRPVVFITDFLRNEENWTKDPPRGLPFEPHRLDALDNDGRRFLFGNAAARTRWNAVGKEEGTP